MPQGIFVDGDGNVSEGPNMNVACLLVRGAAPLTTCRCWRGCVPAVPGQWFPRTDQVVQQSLALCVARSAAVLPRL